jgi:hypothetical protein
MWLFHTGAAINKLSGGDAYSGSGQLLSLFLRAWGNCATMAYNINLDQASATEKFFFPPSLRVPKGQRCHALNTLHLPKLEERFSKIFSGVSGNMKNPAAAGHPSDHQLLSVH